MIDGFAHEPLARRRLLRLLTWTWCLPTTLVGLVAGWVAVTFLAGHAAAFRGATVVRSRHLRGVGAVCLGPVILVADTATPELVAHEWGHFRQHLRLGALYLLVIGIPSATHAVWHRLRGGTFPEYFHFWTEAWADHLGGVYERHAHRHPRWTGYALGPLLTVGLAIVIARAFGHILGFPFTDADALADVAWARFPLRDQLLVPLTGGVGGDNANFWRPAAMVQFWALRHAFDEAPAGWHAWSLALHLATSVLVGLLLEALLPAVRSAAVPTRSDRAVAALGALLFAAHPLAEEVVPATARNLDLLLGLGFFGALLALVRAVVARREGRRGTVASALFFAMAALALATKEAGVLLLPVGAVWIVLLDGRPLGAWRARLPDLARQLGPFAIAAAAFLAVRARVLGGVGGYRDADTLGEVGLFGYATQRGFLEPLLPSLSVALKPLQGVPGLLLTVAIWAALLWGLRRHARLLVALGVVYVPWILLLGLTGTYSRRVLYVPTVAVAAVLALGLVEIAGSFSWGGAPPSRPPCRRPPGAGCVGRTILAHPPGWPRLSPRSASGPCRAGRCEPRARRLREPYGLPRNARRHAGWGTRAATGLLAVVSLSLLGAWLHGTPALRRYTDWDAAGRVATPFLDPAVWAPVPDGATVWLVDRPARVDLDPRRYRLWSKRKSLANVATSYAIEAWVDEHVPRNLKLRSLTSIVPEGPPEAFAGTISVGPDEVRVVRPPTQRTVTTAKGVEVVEEADAVIVRAKARSRPVWLVVWDPRTPVTAVVHPPVTPAAPSP
ncbi:MAG: hypothetical protein Q8P41_22485 [Pseudomonadota bacterium]|nr:hypothetical protein [Pseudomonadota bacterium]